MNYLKGFTHEFDKPRRAKETNCIWRVNLSMCLVPLSYGISYNSLKGVKLSPGIRVTKKA